MTRSCAMRASPEGTRPVGARSAKPIARGDAAKQRQAPIPAHITPARITQATDAGEARGRRFLGNRAVSNEHSIGLSCHHCDVSWSGCAAECCCPECGAEKGYHEDDWDECYCAHCRRPSA